MLFMASNGFRAVAHDRRGHGRSSQPWNGNTMDDYADDLAAVIDTLDDDLTKIDVPTLIIHGDDDQIVPIDASASLAAAIVQGAELNVYPGASHGLFATHTSQFDADLLDFIKR